LKPSPRQQNNEKKPDNIGLFLLWYDRLVIFDYDMRKWWILFLTVVVCAGLAAYVWRTRSSVRQQNSYAGPVEKITVANIGQFSIFNLIAKEQGYFELNGLDARVDEYDSGAPSMAALLGGDADFAVAADFVGVRNLFAHKDLKVIAVVSQHDVFRLVARRDKGISTPADLSGKKIGLTRRTASEFYLGYFLAFNRLSLENVTLIDLSPAEMSRQIESGEIDAALTFEPYAYDLTAKLGRDVIAWSVQGDQKALGLAYTTASFADRFPQVVEKYVRSLIMAEQYVKEHNTQAKRFVASALSYDQGYIDYIWPKFSFVVTLNQDLILTMEDQARWLMEAGLETKQPVPNYLNAIYFPALEAVKPTSVTIAH
jgi:NitT/TauT family transport system substrate-binding protein